MQNVLGVAYFLGIIKTLEGVCGVTEGWWVTDQQEGCSHSSLGIQVLFLAYTARFRTAGIVRSRHQHSRFRSAALATSVRGICRQRPCPHEKRHLSFLIPSFVAVPYFCHQCEPQERSVSLISGLFVNFSVLLLLDQTLYV